MTAGPRSPRRTSASRFALLAQTSTLAELGRAGCLDGASAAWSMWAGYLDSGSGRRAGELLAQFEVPLEVMHASGHATVADLRRLVDAITPKAVGPGHTAAPNRYADLFPNVQVRHDRESWTL